MQARNNFDNGKCFSILSEAKLTVKARKDFQKGLFQQFQKISFNLIKLFLVKNSNL